MCLGRVCTIPLPQAPPFSFNDSYHVNIYTRYLAPENIYVCDLVEGKSP